ncbi:MAG: glutamate synthase central domain-containing protein [Lentisphaeria bacterium]
MQKDTVDQHRMLYQRAFKTDNAAGLPRAVGLYDPAFEHDSCGVGFVARMEEDPTHEVVEKAVEVLVNLEHRGAVGGDKATGDGAGLLAQLPHEFMMTVCEKEGINVPAVGEYGVGMIFLPQDKGRAERCMQALEQVIESEGAAVLGWRDVPTDTSDIGEFARETEPQFKQVVVGCGAIPVAGFERKLYVIRRLVEKQIEAWDDADYSQFYVGSLSTRTIVYKGMLTGTQLLKVFPDLTDRRFKARFAIVHQRYSTNTLPAWKLAQPFRMVAHNGEINTLRGNITRMRSREAHLQTELFGADIEKLKPIITEGGSDSASFDSALELLTSAGRSLPHSAMMMVPQAWGEKFHMSRDLRAFYDYHSAVMEPWDGPAALVFTDGRYIGATLDRNGLRPARYAVTDDGFLVLASETGVLDLPPDKVYRRGRLQPGRMLLVDLEEQRIVPDREIKGRISRRKPYRRWVEDNRIELRGLLEASNIPPMPEKELRRAQHTFGYTREELKMILDPMASNGQEPIGSMGNDEPLSVLAKQPQLLYTYFKQLFAQVTNPPIDPLREELVMSLMSYVGRERNLLEESPEHCRQLKLHHPILTPEDIDKIRRSENPDVAAVKLDMLFPANSDGAALKSALDSLFAEAEHATKEGATLIILSDRKIYRNYAPIPAYKPRTTNKPPKARLSGRKELP